MSSFEFPGEYYEVIRKDLRDVTAETDFLASYLPPGGRVLDIGSGTGTNLRALAALGHPGVGIDQSASFTEFAREAAKAAAAAGAAGAAGAEAAEVEYVHTRTADFTIDQRFDLAYSLFSTLNQLTRDELKQLFADLHGWLAPGGHVVIDIGHLLNFVDGYQPNIIAHHQGDGLLVTRLARQSVNPHAAIWRNEETVIVRGADGQVSMYANFFDQAVLTSPEVRDLLAAAGFEVVAEYGGFRKEPGPRVGRGPLLFVARATTATTTRTAGTEAVAA
ncbi:class I SAM-dependent methyltransferase [Kitasatospora sp. MAP5-34]|uniref:class I SAM-dependent methyltransferase n=1 Tax=Kitasatospora sp. MAP5-34 TaxID=3035102 RepID=UPI002476E3E4|nr:class I SAM-dependent methyltransferase [Kitasatospora sp. MAP5-34]